MIGERASAPQRLVVAVTGASGGCYAIRLLEVLKDTPIETHLVVSKAGQQALSYECGISGEQIRALADCSYPATNIGAAIASGSFRALGMVIAPCSVKSLAELASGVTSNLVTRAGDVTLKERRRLVLMVRETPLTLVHLRNMTTLTEMGAVIAPPVPAFYAHPASLTDMVDHTVGRVLDLFDIEHTLVHRWEEPGHKPTRSTAVTHLTPRAAN